MYNLPVCEETFCVPWISYFNSFYLFLKTTLHCWIMDPWYHLQYNDARKCHLTIKRDVCICVFEYHKCKAFILHKKNVTNKNQVSSVYLQTLLTVDSARLRDEEGKTVIHCAAEQGKSHTQFIELNPICSFCSRPKLNSYCWLCFGLVHSDRHVYYVCVSTHVDQCELTKNKASSINQGTVK